LLPTLEEVHVEHGYIVGIGSNVEPERNSIKVVDRLAECFGPISVSRMYYTDPVGMVSVHRFVNFCAFVRTGLDRARFKAVCSQIETELGRDRTRPGSKTADRPADIDVLAEVPCKELLAANVADGAYLVQPASEIIALLLGEMPMPQARGELCVVTPLGEMPTTVDHDDRTGLVVIRQDGFGGQPH
jgi:2-amino-4-hydroxy-6-hydroxymethyldihydropteridine diphosphokinase